MRYLILSNVCASKSVAGRRGYVVVPFWGEYGFYGVFRYYGLLLVSVRSIRSVNFAGLGL